MHLGMAVHAILAQQVLVAGATGQPCATLQLAGMEGGGVTLLAKERGS